MKTRLSYTVRLSKAPGESAATPVPVIVNRRPPVSLTKVVENAIDRGLIVGPKASAAEEIARGIADQTYREFLDGNGVAFGQYFYGRIYLDGTVGDNGTLTKANGVNVRLYKGEEFRLGLDDFSFSFEGADSQPKIDWLLATGQGDASVRNVLIAGSPVSVQGTFLNLGRAGRAYVPVACGARRGQGIRGDGAPHAGGRHDAHFQQEARHRKGRRCSG